jgi:hypothetical protein
VSYPFLQKGRSMSGVRLLSRSNRLQLLLIGGALALAFLVGAAKASAAGDPGTSTAPTGDGTVIVVPGGDGGIDHTDPYGKG